MKNYKLVFEKIVFDLGEYVTRNKLNCVVLGISGGIDSSVCAIICKTVAERYGIRSIGVSMPLKNKKEEKDTAKKILKGVYNEKDRFTLPLHSVYDSFQELIWNDPQSNHKVPETEDNEEDTYEKLNLLANNQNKLINGNIMARIRMILLYNLAGRYKGIVIDTDNMTENTLGFFTIHGDQGDYKPIGDLWKTDVYGLALWMLKNLDLSEQARMGLEDSINLVPTDGNDVSKSDLEQIGGNSYEEVDVILKKHIFNDPLSEEEEKLYSTFTEELKDKVLQRHYNSKFKRRQTPKSHSYVLLDNIPY